MDLVDAWTGRTACALQAALRLSNELFAGQLGVAVRTVANWHKNPDVTPRTEMQQLLDTALERASDAVRSRFQQIVRQAAVDDAPPLPRTPDNAQSLRVAVAVVVTDHDVLLVCRRGDDGGGISWQFPSGVVKPGAAPELVAVRETFAETGVHCAVVRSLGNRLHPITKVWCEYLLCDYLTGEAQNADVIENAGVAWADRAQVTRFIPAEQIFPPILEALEIPA